MKKTTGWNYMLLALLAFAGLGIEVLLALCIEPLLYGAQIGEWNTPQNIAHWVLTCLCWGAVMIGLVRYADKKYDFDVFAKGSKVKVWQWLLTAAFVVFSLVTSFISWNGFKVIIEYHANGPLKFVFQYIYYIFEAGLMTLILVFAQLAFEEWFQKKNIPYGGIILALTWGLAHCFTKDISTGIWAAISGLGLGCVYLLTGRDIRKAYPIIFAMFVL